MNKKFLDFIYSRLDLKFIRRIPQILQTEAAECGLACLAMVCGHYGMHIDLLSLRQKFDISSRGVALDVLIDMADSLNLKSRALSLDLNELKELKTPCILHWDMSHFVVLVKIKGNKVIIHDPAFGKRILGMAEISQHFTGVALEIWPSKQFEPMEQKSKLSLRNLFNSVTNLKGALLKIFAFSLIVESVNLLMPVGTQLVIDHVIKANDKSLLAVICLGLIAFTLLRTFASLLRAWVSIVIESLINVQWKTGLFDHLMKLPVSYFEKRKLGDIQARFSSLDTIRTTFTNNIVQGIIDGMMVIGLFIMMLLYGGWLIWLVLGFTFIYMGLRLFTYKYYRQASEEKIVKDAKVGSHFMETLYGISSLKALGLIGIRSQFWLNLNIDSVNAGIKITKLDLLFGGINTFINTIEQITILWLGATMIINNQMTLGMFIAFTAYRSQFSDRAAKLIDMALQLRILSLHNERIADIVLSQQEKYVSCKKLKKPQEAATLEVKQLYYQYDSLSQPIIDDFNLSVKAGESLAIIGPSGIGKTTLMKLMCGLLEPSKGSILINGVDIFAMGLNNYRDFIACVLQDDKLFSGSIAENVAGFTQTPDQERIISCCQSANIHEEIMQMPMTYETLISELGGSLSGGQKQRLMIARALYRKPNILFMDEATSHLDTENEKHINEAIAGMNITRVIIAHRASTIESTDRVIILGQKTI